MRDYDEAEAERVVGSIMRAHPPLDDIPNWPEHVTPAVLIGMAEARSRATLRGRARHTASALIRPRSVKVAIGCALASVVVALAYTPAGASAPVTPPIIAVDTNSNELAAPYLAQLVRRVAARIEPMKIGVYSYTRCQTWSLDVNGDDPGADKQVMAQDEQTWWAANVVGKRIVTRLPPQSPQSSHAQWTVTLPEVDAASRTSDEPAPGEMSVVLKQPPSTDPRTLTVQLGENEPPPQKPLSRVRTIAQMYRYHVLNPAQRAAVLQVLADTPGVIYRGPITDRSNRTGMAVSIDSEDSSTRDVLVFDAATGWLLSHEQINLKADGDLPANSVTAYVLYLDHQMTDLRG